MIIEVLQQAVQSNLEQVVLMEVVIGFLYLINIVLGTLLGSISKGFDFKKFIFGLLKSFGVLVMIFALCYTLNLFMIVLNLIDGLEISIDIVTPLQILAILVTWGIDMSKEVLEKVKGIRELKYVKEEDVKLVDYNVATDDKG